MKGTGYLLQATIVTLWWIGLYFSPPLFEAFQFPGIGSVAFRSFFLPDLLVIIVLSLVRAYRKNDFIAYTILGGFAFGTLYCVNASWLTKGGYLSTSLMILGLCYNLFLLYGNFAFRQSASRSPYLNGLKTILQICCVWSITLILFPMLINHAFNKSLFIDFSQIHAWVGIVLFIICSMIGLASAYVIVTLGMGTPLPLDQTQNLVRSGPYKYVRNPMAVAGIGQGIAIGIIYLSIPIIIYAVMGALLWQFVVRPLEEENMSGRFGEAYKTYKKEINCWVPKFK